MVKKKKVGTPVEDGLPRLFTIEDIRRLMGRTGHNVMFRTSLAQVERTFCSEPYVQNCDSDTLASACGEVATSIQSMVVKELEILNPDFDFEAEQPKILDVGYNIYKYVMNEIDYREYPGNELMPVSIISLLYAFQLMTIQLRREVAALNDIEKEKIPAGEIQERQRFEWLTPIPELHDVFERTNDLKRVHEEVGKLHEEILEESQKIVEVKKEVERIRKKQKEEAECQVENTEKISKK